MLAWVRRQAPFVFAFPPKGRANCQIANGQIANEGGGEGKVPNRKEANRKCVRRAGWGSRLISKGYGGLNSDAIWGDFLEKQLVDELIFW